MKQFILLIACIQISLSSFAQKHLWGMSAAKGAVYGTIFRTDSAGNGYTDIYTFTSPLYGTDPYGSLLKALDGNLYGLTSRGGAFNFGVIFRINPVTGIYSKLHDFDSVEGRTPYGSLVQAPDGKLYGMTYGGSGYLTAHDMGVMFSFDPVTAAFTKKIDFRMDNGCRPYGSLTVGADGMLYGLSSAGGVDATGYFFRYDIGAGIIDGLGDFVSGPLWEGYEPTGNIIQATNGKFYGLSHYGGAMGSGGGVIFRYDPAAPSYSRMAALHKLSEVAPGAADGYELPGSLIQAGNGKLYGMTQLGGANNVGTIFEYNLATNSYTRLHDFDSVTEGYKPYGSLMQASNGKLYGLTTSEGGIARLFAYDIASNLVTVMANITGTPYYTSLIETNESSVSIAEPVAYNDLKVYPVPAANIITIGLPAAFSNGRMIITGINGQTVKDQAASGGTMNIADMAPGVYFMTVTANGNSLRTSFVKE